MLGFASRADALAASTTEPPATYQLDDGSYAAAVPWPFRCGVLPDGRRVRVASWGAGRWRVVCGAGEPDVRCEVGCRNQASWIAAASNRRPLAVCDFHARQHFPIRAPLLRDPLVASIVAASFHGALIGPAADLLAQWLAGDETARGPLEDLAHQLEVTDERGAWPVTPRERVSKHGTPGNPHVWLPYDRGPGLGFTRMRRCTCGKRGDEFSDIYDAATEDGDAAAP